MRQRISNKEVTYEMIRDAGYSLDDQGRVLGKSGRPLRPRTSRYGYNSIGLSFGGRGVTYNFRYHRAVWMLANQQNIPELFQIDHINRDRADNRPENLQIMSSDAEHMIKDQAGRRQSNTKPWTIPNVAWHKRRKKWRVQFQISGKSKYFGYFDDFREACERRNKVAAEIGYPLVSKNEIDEAKTHPFHNKP